MENDNTEIDQRIKSAAEHWTHRFVVNGVPLSDFQDVVMSITHWNEWCSAWSQRGHVHAELGDKALSSNFNTSAGEHYSTAAVCYHFAKFLFVHDKQQMFAAHSKAISMRSNALPLLEIPGERIEINWNGKILYGNFRKPLNVDDPPVVVMAMGLDSAKEEMHSNEDVFLRRGLATLSFDGPGQGEAEYEIPIHPDYEEPVSAVIDYIETRNDCDATRIGIWGVSLGGYYAPRAAAFENRIRACVSLTGPFEFSEAFEFAPPLTKAAFISRCHANSEQEARHIAEKMTLEGVADRVRCPTYVVGGTLDRVLPPEHAIRLANAVKGDVILNIIEDGTHVANNRPYKYRTQVGDWLASVL